jgi:hypothetical protein
LLLAERLIGSVYLFAEYHLSAQHLKCGDAATYCAHQGMKLAVIRSKQEWERIIIEASSASCGIGHAGCPQSCSMFWVGARNKEDKGCQSGSAAGSHSNGLDLCWEWQDGSHLSKFVPKYFRPRLVFRSQHFQTSSTHSEQQFGSVCLAGSLNARRGCHGVEVGWFAAESHSEMQVLCMPHDPRERGHAHARQNLFGGPVMRDPEGH